MPLVLNGLDAVGAGLPGWVRAGAKASMWSLTQRNTHLAGSRWPAGVDRCARNPPVRRISINDGARQRRVAYRTGAGVAFGLPAPGRFAPLHVQLLGTPLELLFGFLLLVLRGAMT